MPKTKVRIVDKVTVGAVTFNITYSDDPRTVIQDKDATIAVHGVQSGNNGYIGLHRTTVPGRMGQTFLHELVHAIVNEYSVDSLMDENGKHDESDVDRIGLGIYLALKSMGIHIEDFLRVKEDKK